MSETKRSKIESNNQVAAYALFSFITTLKRLKLAEEYSDIHRDIDRMFLVWDFAKKYGVEASDKKH